MSLTTEALRALYAAKSPLVIDDLFFADRKASSAEKAEADDQHWQRDVLRLLVARGAIVEEPPQYFAVGDKEEFSAILSNTEEDGRLLEEIVFPDPKRQAASDILDRAGAEAAEPDVVTGEQLLETLVNQIATNHKAFHSAMLTLTSLTQAVGATTEAISTQNMKILEQAQQNTRATNNRIDKLEERITAEQRVTEAMQATLKTVSAALGDINASARAMTEVASSVQRATELLLKVASQLDREDGDKVGKLVRSLSAHLEEGKVLHEALLDVATERKS
jgi:methyl-accepting chemotaxis protein